MSKHILVVGAGMAGISAARTLQQAGHQVTVLDKGRGVGGRMATRRVNAAVFDHGAQFFTVRDPRFAALVEGLQANGDAHLWANGFPNAQGEQSAEGHPRYRGTQGMNSIPKALAVGLTVHTSTQVSQINSHDGRWQIIVNGVPDGTPQHFEADALVMTPPAEQTLTLMRSGNVTLPADALLALEAIQFHPCFAVMVTLDRPSAIAAPGGVFVNGEPISWIADNQQKGISAVPCVTIHASPTFTRAHYDTPQDEVARLLIEAAHDYLGDAVVTDQAVHRWRYSQPSVLHPEATLLVTAPAPVAFAGDAFNSARVEGAALSGIAAAEALIHAL
ncbi:MAG: NAD(P)/FAD-dependent oxidoreductase [Phototrophicaceae bacterium]|jgi:predicted NAD/FAD-dependent oxidoreductase